jgi:hypothetical protein
MIIDVKLWHDAKTLFPRVVTDEGVENITVVKLVQF